MNQTPSYGAYIPAPVRYDKRLPPAVKLLYGEITALSNAEGYCWAGNQYFATLYDVDKKTVSAWISLLHKLGYISVVLDKNAGNDRRIYLAEALINAQVGYTEKNGYLSTKSRIAIYDKMDTYPQNHGHNIITNNTMNNLSLNRESTRTDLALDCSVNSEKLDSKPPTKENNTQQTYKPKRSKGEAVTTNLVLDNCDFPEHWTPTMKSLYAAQWLPFRQKVGKKPLLLESVRAQIEKLASLTEEQLTSCINDSIANGWSGLFPDKYLNTQHTLKNDRNNPINNRSGYNPVDHVKKPFVFDLDTALADLQRAGQANDQSGHDYTNFLVVE